MKPKPAKDLSIEARKLWKRIAREIVMDEPAVVLLNILCQEWDRLTEARQILKAKGIIVKDRFGQEKPHPACAVERDAVTAVSRAWRLLGFDLIPPGLEK